MYNVFHINYRSISQRVKNEGTRKRKTREEEKKYAEAPWEDYDIENYHYDTKNTVSPATAVIDMSRTGVTLLKIFFSFVTRDLLYDIHNDVPYEDWDYKLDHHLHVDHWLLYEVLAHQIYIQGQQNTSHRDRDRETGQYQRHLKKDVNAARQHLKNSTTGNFEPMGGEAIQIVMSRWHIWHAFYDDLSKNFRKIIHTPGEILCCDEKLFHFTGTSPHITLVINKPAKIGLWFYEACILLARDNLPFLVDMFMKEGKDDNKDTGTMADVIVHWRKVADELITIVPGITALLPHILFDSLYFCKSTRLILRRDSQPYSASCRLDRIKHITKYIKTSIEKPGDYGGVWCPTTSELVVQKMEKAKGLGLKTVISNAYVKVKGKQPIGVIPAYTFYSKGFSICDNYNKGLTGHTWAHKHGGHGRSGEEGKQHDFAMSCILHNTFNIYRALKQVDPAMFSYETYCTSLAEQLYFYSHDARGN